MFSVCFTLSFLMTSCASRNLESQKEIIQIWGKWQVSNFEFIGDPHKELSELAEKSLFNFFGADRLKNSEGKSFTFKDEGFLETDLIPSEFSEKFQIYYSLDDQVLDIFIKIRGSNEELNYETMIQQKSEKELIWIIDGLFKLNLSK